MSDKNTADNSSKKAGSMLLGLLIII